MKKIKSIFSLVLLLTIFISVSSVVIAQEDSDITTVDAKQLLKAVMQELGLNNTPKEISYNTFMGRDFDTADSGLKGLMLTGALSGYGQKLVDFQEATKDFVTVLNQQGSILKIDIATQAYGFLDRCYNMLETAVIIPAEHTVSSTPTVKRLTDDNRYLRGWLAERGLPIRIETLQVGVNLLSRPHVKIYDRGGNELNFQRIVVTGDMNGNKSEKVTNVYTMIPHMDGMVTLLKASISGSPLATNGRFETKLIPILDRVKPEYAAKQLVFLFVKNEDIRKLGLPTP